VVNFTTQLLYLQKKIWSPLSCTVKYAHDLTLLAVEETVLQGMTNRLTEIGRCYGMEINVEKKLRL
jgi:hypothetical protein